MLLVLFIFILYIKIIYFYIIYKKGLKGFDKIQEKGYTYNRFF